MLPKFNYPEIKKLAYKLILSEICYIFVDEL